MEIAKGLEILIKDILRWFFGLILFMAKAFWLVYFVLGLIRLVIIASTPYFKNGDRTDIIILVFGVLMLVAVIATGPHNDKTTILFLSILLSIIFLGFMIWFPYFYKSELSLMDAINASIGALGIIIFPIWWNAQKLKKQKVQQGGEKNEE